MLRDAHVRLRAERSRLGLSQVEFGKLGGVSKNTQMAYENGTSPITLDYLGKVSEHGVNVGYVLSGEADEGPKTSGDDMVEIKEIDLHYGMGGSFLSDDIGVETRVFSRNWLRNFTRAAPEHLFWTIGDGDSMEPTIRSGELILIDGSQRHVRVNDGVWAVALGEIGMIKRIHFAGDERIELLSDNQLVPPNPVGFEEIHVIGRVVAVVRRL
ncbi:MAG: XRE family transcriptional regulator [Novosphingobium sp.]